MNSTLKNVLAVIAGLVGGSIVNMLIVMASGSIIPLPEGVDPANIESLKESMHLFEPKHFVLPFLAHALGTLVGAFLTGVLAASSKLKLAFVIGGFFLLGGIANIFMLGGPLYFTVVDLVFAYIPMAWFGGNMALKFSKGR